METYIKYSEEFDQLSSEEQALLDKAVVSIKETVQLTPEINGRKTRNFHAKSHAFIYGRYTPETKNTLSSLNPFPQNECEVLARFSNAETQITEDRFSLPAYGISLKISNSEGFEANFPMVNFPVFVTNSVKDLLNMVMAVNQLTQKKEKDENILLSMLNILKEFGSLTIHTGIIKLIDVFKNGLTTKRDSVLNVIYHSIGCYRFGDAACKFRVVPLQKFPTEGLENLSQQEVIQRVLRETDYEVLLQVQISKSLENQPINDLMKEWPDDFETIGRLLFPKQEIITAENTSMEDTDFSPFRNHSQLLPVGKIQRTRLEAYKASAEARRSKD